LSIISEDLSVRLWDVDSGENFVLEPKGASYSSDECFISIDFNANTGITSTTGFANR
jgi:WD40 repeat protein